MNTHYRPVFSFSLLAGLMALAGAGAAWFWSRAENTLPEPTELSAHSQKQREVLERVQVAPNSDSQNSSSPKKVANQQTDASQPQSNNEAASRAKLEKELGLLPNMDFLFDEPKYQGSLETAPFVSEIPPIRWHASCETKPPEEKFDSLENTLAQGKFSGAEQWPTPQAMLDFNRYYEWKGEFVTLGVRRRSADRFVVRAFSSQDKDFANETKQLTVPGYEEGELSATEALALAKQVEGIWLAAGARKKSRTQVLRAESSEPSPDLAEFRNGRLVRFVHKAVTCNEDFEKKDLVCGCVP